MSCYIRTVCPVILGQGGLGVLITGRALGHFLQCPLVFYCSYLKIGG